MMRNIGRYTGLRESTKEFGGLGVKVSFAFNRNFWENEMYGTKLV